MGKMNPKAALNGVMKKIHIQIEQIIKHHSVPVGAKWEFDMTSDEIEINQIEQALQSGGDFLFTDGETTTRFPEYLLNQCSIIWTITDE